MGRRNRLPHIYSTPLRYSRISSRTRPKHGEPFLFRSLDGCRIVEAVMQRDGRAGQDRAGLASVIADREHEIERLVREFVHVLGAVAGDVDPELRHHGDGFRPHAARAGSGAENLEAIAGVVTQQAFRHLAAGGVSGAQNEDALLVVMSFLRRSCRKPASGKERRRDRASELRDDESRRVDGPDAGERIGRGARQRHGRIRERRRRREPVRAP